ncbi:MAG: pseudouridine synthase [Sphaerochaetaceae bacterium]
MEQANPRVIFENDSILAAFKPKGLPTAPLKHSSEATLLGWALDMRPSISAVKGRSLWEPGLLHRLDTPTSGLVLIAKTQEAFDALNRLQESDMVVKYYHADISRFECDSTYPPLDEELDRAMTWGFPDRPFAIESHFRSFGVGRKAVRPCRASGKNASRRSYETRFLHMEGGRLVCSITNGFRHQIRCHCAWMGWPVNGDRIYGPSASASKAETGRLGQGEAHNQFTDDDDGSLALECFKIKFPSIDGSGGTSVIELQ